MDDERTAEADPQDETETTPADGTTSASDDQGGHAPEVASKPEPGEDREPPDHSGIADKPGPPL